ncbi:IclR family transcriptional regulator [Gordonia sp. NPDC003376]
MAGTIRQTDTAPADRIDDPAAHAASVLGKATAIFAAFTDGPTTMGLTELSRRSGVPKASAHRLAVELSTLGMLTRTPDGYQLGWRMFELGQLVPGPAGLRALARPTLTDLRSATHGVVHLAIPQEDRCVYLERFAGRRDRHVLGSVGHRVPLHATASGHLFLAYSETDRCSGLDSSALERLGVRDRSALTARFADIRERRHTTENQMCVAGFKTTAVPVFHPGTSRIFAAISVTRTSERRDDQPVLHALWAAANDIMQGLRRAVGASTHEGIRLVS